MRRPGNPVRAVNWRFYRHAKKKARRRAKPTTGASKLGGSDVSRFYPPLSTGKISGSGVGSPDFPRAEGETMNAARKVNSIPEINAGHRMAWISELLSNPELPISTDARLLLCVLLAHHGDGGVRVGTRRLSMMCHMSFGRCLAARDELVSYGLVRCRIGAGTRATDFDLIGLEAWFADWVAARSVPDSSVSVPDSSVSVPAARTKPMEPSEPEKAGKPGLKVVEMAPPTGWPALVHRAPKLEKDMWLGRMRLDGTAEDGTVRLVAPTSLHADKVRRMLADDPAIRSLAESVGLDPDRIEIRCPSRHGIDPYARREVREGDPAGHDEKRSMGRRMLESMDRIGERLEAADDPERPPPARPPAGNVTDLNAYRTKRQDDQS